MNKPELEALLGKPVAYLGTNLGGESEAFMSERQAEFWSNGACKVEPLYLRSEARQEPTRPATVTEMQEIADALDEFSDIDEAEGGNPHVIKTERRAAVLLREAALAARPAGTVGGDLVRRLNVAADGIEKCDLGRASLRRGYENILREAASALLSTHQPPCGERFSIEHDGFVGSVIGHYQRLDGKRGVVLQQDGTNIVHVYGEKWLKPAADETSQRGGERDSEDGCPYDWRKRDLRQAWREGYAAGKRLAKSMEELTPHELQLLMQLQDARTANVHDVVEHDPAKWAMGKALSKRGYLALVPHPRGGTFHITHLGDKAVDAARSSIDEVKGDE